MNIFRYMLYRKFKNSNFLYYFKNFLSYAWPDFLFRRRLKAELAKAADYDPEYIAGRVRYYNKLDTVNILGKEALRVRDFRCRRKKFTPHSYFFDTYAYTRFFPPENRMSLLFGDLRHVPACPSIVKSRPTAGDNRNSVLLNLNKLRHFMFVKDPLRFLDKKDMLLGRCSIYQENRVKFWEMYFGHPLCDLGHVARRKKPSPHPGAWTVPPMAIYEHLRYKFILSLEGNDVATNLKWIMSSNSLAVMPKPSCETWFMEGRLIGDYHYVEIKEDYSDLPDKLDYYLKNPARALEIIENAHSHVAQFQDKRREKLISLLVLKKYFEHVKPG